MTTLPTLTKKELDKLRALIEDGREHLFYCGSKWQRARKYVLRLDRYECQLCKSRGQYAKATHVHHVQHLKQRPDLALSVFDDGGGRQLVSVCRACHEECHPERAPAMAVRVNRFSTVERWD